MAHFGEAFYASSWREEPDGAIAATGRCDSGDGAFSGLGRRLRSGHGAAAVHLLKRRYALEGIKQ
jgi:hypothetical protein